MANPDDDLAQGTYYEYHPDGTASFAIEYERARLHGSIRRWAPNGQLIYEATLVDDVLQGPYKRWHDNGQLAETCSYRDGKRHGTLVMYDTEGNVLIELELVDDVPVLDND